MMLPSMFCMNPRIQSVMVGKSFILLTKESVPWRAARVQSREQSATVVLISWVTLKV